MKLIWERKDIIRVRATFSWQPPCELIKTNGQVDTFKLYFIARRNPPSRFFIGTGTVTVKCVLKDIYSHFAEFLPLNTFLPNGDGINDEFRLNNLPLAPSLQAIGEPNPNLPYRELFF